MRFSIEHGPAFAWLKVQLAPSEVVTAEAGAMVRPEPHVAMSTPLMASLKNGIFGVIVAVSVSLIRNFTSGETFSVNAFSTSSPGEAELAQTLSGNIVHRQLGAEERPCVHT